MIDFQGGRSNITVFTICCVLTYVDDFLVMSPRAIRVWVGVGMVQLWKVKVSNVKCPQSLWCPKIQDTHWQSIFTFSTAHIWRCTVMDWRTLTPSDILTDCIYPDNYSLCIICTNNHLIISHPRVKSVLFRLHPPVISSFIQTHVTFETLIRA